MARSVKRYSIRLYARHDIDLITFLCTHEFDFIKACYCALSAFIKGDVFIIDIPPKKPDRVLTNKTVFKQLTLDEEMDGDIIELLEKIKPGYRNNFIKNILRLYLCNPISEEALIDETDTSQFMNMFNIFKQNKRRAQAGKVKKRSKSVQSRDEIFSDIFELDANKSGRDSEKKEKPKKEIDVSEPKNPTVSKEENPAVTNEEISIIDNNGLSNEPVVFDVPEDDQSDDLTAIFASLL